MPPRFPDIQGVWLLESFSQDGEQESIQIGANAAQQPWIEISADDVSGEAGCNHFGSTDEDPYVFETGALMLGEIFINAAGCMSDTGADVMKVEGVFTSVVGRSRRNRCRNHR